MLTAPFLGSCSIRAPPWGRGSAGRASPLQGEGQEFESARLHRRYLSAYHGKSARAERCRPRRGGQPANNQLPDDRAFEPLHVVVPCPDSSERCPLTSEEE